MKAHSQLMYQFGPFHLDPARRLLRRDGRSVALTPKALETLALLVQNHGNVVEKDVLMRHVWPDTFVEEGSLTRNISVLRKTLGESPSDHQYIATVPRRGYCFVAPVAEVSGDEPPPPPPARRRRGKSLALAAVVLLLLGLGYGMRRLIRRLEPPTTAAMRITRFTATGRAIDAALSPDGRQVAYVEEEAGRQALQVRRVAAAESVEVLPPREVSYQGLAFSPDGNFIYYNLWDRQSYGVIYRVPVTGGASQRVVADVMPSLSLSPDGRRIAFIRSYSSAESSGNGQALLVADVDGGGERKLLTHTHLDWSDYPAWSPDGRRIAAVVGSAGEDGKSLQVIEVPADGGPARPLTGQQWIGIGGLAWRGDGRGLMLAATDQAEGPLQLWSLSYPGGEARQLTNDLNGYRGISLAADAGALITLQEDALSNIWVAPAADTARAQRVTAGRFEGMSFSWAPDGRVVYVTGAEHNPEIWIMDRDGGNKRQLTFDEHLDFGPTVSADGRRIVFVSNRSGKCHLWQMGLDGGGQQQLTDGSGEWGPVSSPVGNFIVYFSADTGKGRLWKLSLDGGRPVRLTTHNAYLPAISPDGRRLAYSFWDEEARPQRFGRRVIRLADGREERHFQLPPTAMRETGKVLLRWSADGRALTYVDNRGGMANIWSLPLDGGPARQLTDFKEDRIFWFDWSRDGRHIACALGKTTSDVVLVSNLK